MIIVQNTVLSDGTQISIKLLILLKLKMLFM